MTDKLKDRKITIEAELVIPLGELAIYILKKGEEESLLLKLLYNKPEIVNIKIKKIAKEVLRDNKSNVRLKELRFDYNDSDRFSHGASYFKTMLRGTEKELRKIAGENKIFEFDWDEKEE